MPRSGPKDVRDAIRSLIKSPGFTFGAGAVLALAIGASTSIFSVVNTVLLQPLAYPDAERLVSVETLWTNTGRASPDVSAQFFLVFGQTAAAGRLLAEEDVPAEHAEPAVAVVAYHWAANHFGSDEAAIGKTITVYGNAMEIVGVAAPGFRYPGATDIRAPARTAQQDQQRGDHPYQAVGKLKGASSRTWSDNEHGNSRSAGPWEPGSATSSASSLVKGCGWSRSDSYWDLWVRSPWHGC